MSSITSWLLPPQPFAHVALETIGQAETDEVFGVFFPKKLQKVSLLYFRFPEIKESLPGGMSRFKLGAG